MIRFTKLAVFIALTMQKPLYSVGLSEDATIDQDQSEETLANRNLRDIAFNEHLKDMIIQRTSEQETFEDEDGDEDGNEDEDEGDELTAEEKLEKLFTTKPDKHYRETILNLYNEYEGDELTVEKLEKIFKTIPDKHYRATMLNLYNAKNYDHLGDYFMTYAYDYLDNYEGEDKKDKREYEAKHQVFINKVLGFISQMAANDPNYFEEGENEDSNNFEMEDSTSQEQEMTHDEAKERIDEIIANYVPEHKHSSAHGFLTNEEYYELDDLLEEHFEEAPDDVKYDASEALATLALASPDAEVREYSYKYMMPIEVATKRCYYVIKKYVPKEFQKEATELFEAKEYTKFSDLVMENITSEQAYGKVERGGDVYDLLAMPLSVLIQAKKDPPPEDDGLVHPESHFEDETVENFKDELLSFADGE